MTHTHTETGRMIVLRPSNPLETAVLAIKELKEQLTCSSCGRHFTITPERQNQCARCSSHA